MAGRAKDKNGFDLDTFDFESKFKVLTALEMLDEPTAIKFLQKMRQRHLRAFMWHLYTQPKLRAMVLKGLNLIAENKTVLGTLTVTRTVVNNPRMDTESQKVFAVTEFDPDNICRFVKKHCKAFERCVLRKNLVKSLNAMLY